ncbi:CCA tRNA nucleotidyltransferase [Candidatus Daviesbacteria bacterium]|nr:CCA tRNA nucleotidyltransferase [Candidatus Daviesbacteria bacterium]
MNYALPNEVKNILNKFQKAGFQIYIVGGAVRDLLMNRKVSDWDFTTDAKPEEILALFPEGFYDNKFGTVGIPSTWKESKPCPSGRRATFQVSTINTSDGGRAISEDSSEVDVFEITTMRKEGKYGDFRHPEQVVWTDKIEEDLARRDFTINAIALSEVEGLIDPFNGQNDIKNKIIRAVGDPETRFQEDALRLMRAIRIATELEFDIEKDTFMAIKKNAHFIKEIAWERIRDELFKLLASMYPYIGIVKLREAGILQIILPELEACFGIVQEGPKHDRVYDIGEHSLLTLKLCPSKNPLVRLAALLHDIGKPDTHKITPDGNVTFYHHDVVGGKIVQQIAKRFNLAKKQTDKLCKLVRWHLFTVDEHQTDSAIRRFIKNVGVENVDDMMDVRIGDRLGGGTATAVSWRMEKYKERIKEVLKKPFSLSDLKINGRDIMKTLNIKSGPKVGEILTKLFDEVLKDSSKNNKEYLLQKIKLMS